MKKLFSISVIIQLFYSIQALYGKKQKTEMKKEKKIDREREI